MLYVNEVKSNTKMVAGVAFLTHPVYSLHFCCHF